MGWRVGSGEVRWWGGGSGVEEGEGHRMGWRDRRGMGGGGVGREVGWGGEEHY